MTSSDGSNFCCIILYAYLSPTAWRYAAAPIEGSIDEAEAVAVTVEPSGGDPAPTRDILLTTSL